MAFRARWTTDGTGTSLKRRSDGSCVFLGQHGCTVHDDRPLVCRLYPLGRHVDSDGRESFTALDGHPSSDGVRSRDGTIAKFLAEQDAAPLLRAADLYYAWYCRVMRLIGDEDEDTNRAAARLSTRAREWLDLDSAVTALCATWHRDEPRELGDRLTLHLQFLDAQLDQFIQGRHVP